MESTVSSLLQKLPPLSIEYEEGEPRFDFPP